MSSFSILPRDSSTPDGVQSRGAGWHSREVPGRNEARRLETLTGELVGGDLVRPSGKLGKLWVHDGHRLMVVKPVSRDLVQHRSDSSKALADSLKGDWPAFWEACQNAASLFYLTPAIDATNRLLTASAGDLAETALRFLPKGEMRPQRALRVIRLWLAGASTTKAVTSAMDAAHAVYSDLVPSSAAYAAYAAYATTASVSHAGSHADAAAQAAVAHCYNTGHAYADVYAAVSRSFSFLVRARTPLWRVCLAAAMRDQS